MYNRYLDQRSGGRSPRLSWTLLLAMGLVVLLAWPGSSVTGRVAAAEESLLSSDITASQERLGPNERVTFTITLRNTGSSDTTADVTGVLPDELAYVPGSATAGGSPEDNHVDWTDVSVPAGGSVPLAFQAEPAVRVSTDTEVTTVAAIMSEHLHFIRLVTITLVPSAEPPPEEPDLSGSRKVASKSTVNPDESFTYTIELNNRGLVATTADVTDPVPSGVTYVSGSVSGGGVYDSGTETLSWNDVDVPAEGSVSLTFDVTADPVDESITVRNTATIAYDDESLDRSVSVLVLPEEVPSVGLLDSTKSASQLQLISGESLTYTITLRNGGDAAVTADVVDELPDEMTYISGSATGGAVYDSDTRTLSWDDVNVPANDTVSLTFAVTAATVDVPTTVINTATISHDDMSFDRHAAVLLLPEEVPSVNLLGSTKSASKLYLASGESLTYTIRLRNSGDVATTADVTDELPQEMTYVSGSATGGGVYDSDTETLSWDDVSVPANDTVSLTFAATAATVDIPRLVDNVATISHDGRSFNRHALVLLIPRPIRTPNLRGSYKTASDARVSSGESLTYTIRLHNSGSVTATVNVTDPVPSGMAYVSGSATEGGVYDAETETLTWDEVSVGSGESVTLRFAVTAEAVDRPTPVINTATIASDDETLRRSFVVLVLPEPDAIDVRSPIVQSLIIGEMDVLESPTVTLHISATDNIAVEEMYIREWRLQTSPFPHWQVAQTSGWVPFQAEYPWTLVEESGAHFVGVWVRDEAGNRSIMDEDAIDYASLLLPDDEITQGGMVPYLVHYEAGQSVAAVLSPSEGDADLYVWYPNSFGLPDERSTNSGTELDSVSFETPREGTYLFLVHGYTAATYDLSITPGGGPGGSVVPTAKAESSIQGANSKPGELAAEPLLSRSGVDPLGSIATPRGPYLMYVPLVAAR
jgi:uncharacterized repeat protein (TIGR01451 family)